jgi:hypothetical protein
VDSSLPLHSSSRLIRRGASRREERSQHYSIQSKNLYENRERWLYVGGSQGGQGKAAREGDLWGEEERVTLGGRRRTRWGAGKHENKERNEEKRHAKKEEEEVEEKNATTGSTETTRNIPGNTSSLHTES